MKITFLGRNLSLFVVVLTTAIIFNSCRKDLLVQSPDNLKNALSIVEAKRYFETQVKNKISNKGKSTFSVKGNGAQLLQDDILKGINPVWDIARFKELHNGKNAVITPIYKKDVYVRISEKKIVKFGFLNYLMMYKDARENIVTEWIELKPTERWIDSKISRNYEGKIIVRNWDGTVKKVYSYSNGSISPSNSPISLVGNKMAAKIMDDAESDSGESIICFVTTKITITSGGTTCPCAGHTFAQLSECTCENKPTHAYNTTITFETEYDCTAEPPLDPPIGGGGPTGTGGDYGNGDGNGTGGGTSPGDYPPENCNPDPSYVVPTVPPPPGTDYILPCSDTAIPVDDPAEDLPEISYEGLDISANTLALAQRLWLTQQEAIFLENNPSIVTAISGYLAQHPYSEEAGFFAKWAVGFIVENTDVDFAELVEMNSISNSTITLPNIIDVTNLADYPAFKSMVENLPAFLNQNPEVLKSLSRYTGFSKTKIMQLMQPGKGPKIELVSNLTGSGQPAFGQYTPGTYTLKINKELVIGLDKVQSPNRYRALGMLLAITTLHEFVHYGRDVNKMTSKINLNGWDYDTGFLFELSISPPYLYNGITRNNAIQWANFYKFNIND